jgi:uncharacterized protein YxjI
MKRRVVSRALDTLGVEYRGANRPRTGILVARIDRKILSGKDIFFGQQTYGVQVAPGVDLALIAALCICLDEKNNEAK